MANDIVTVTSKIDAAVIILFAKSYVNDSLDSNARQPRFSESPQTVSIHESVYSHSLNKYVRHKNLHSLKDLIIIKFK